MSTSGGLRAHLVACASGAALDNLFRQVAVVALTAAAFTAYPEDQTRAGQLASTYSALAMVLFTAPFILLAPIAGGLGDRLAKHRIIRVARIADLPICLVGIWGFATGQPWLLLAALTALGVASAFFAPVKLAVVPELADAPRLASANAALAAVTVVAILAGMCLPALVELHQPLRALASVLPGEASAEAERLAAIAAATPWVPTATLSLLCLCLCALGIVAAYRIPRLQPQAPDQPAVMPWAITTQLRALHGGGLWAPALALAAFWALGTAAAVGIIPIARGVYGFGQAGTVLLVVALVLGVVAGSLLAPRLMRHAFPAGLPIVGALIAGSTLAAAGLTASHDLGTDQPDPQHVMVWLFLCGVGAGLWEVPLTVLLQHRAPAERRNLVMSAVAVLGSIGTMAAAGALLLLTNERGLGLSSADSLQVFGSATVALAAICAVSWRRQLGAWLIASLVRQIWRVRVHGEEHVPREGGCIVACNHLSFADGAVMAASLPRPGRFLVYRKYTELPVVGWVLRAVGVIPVAGEDRRKALLASIDAAVAAAAAGECVVIFPEGKITRSGQMDAFRSGIERIASRAGVPIVPAFLHGLWGGPFSRATRREWPRPGRRLELFIGPSLASSATAAEARAHVMDLAYQHASAVAARDRRTLGSAALALARRRPMQLAIRDAGGAMTRWKLAAVAKALIPLLGLAKDERAVGVMLPPGRGGAIVNLALALAGRTAVNLNHTAGNAQLARMVEMAGLRTVISSRIYLGRIGDPQLPGRVLHAEQLLPRLATWRVLLAALGNLLVPSRLRSGGRPGDTAVIVFSSGSTGDPKGVQLTHRQVLANCRGVREGLDLHWGEDVVLSPLPLFHSFGLIPGMWLGLVEGLSVASQPDPSDGKALSELAGVAKATFLLSTPTFVRGYMRRADPEGFRSLRFAVVGAERCPAELKQQFKERFGADLLEGYGCTELAPVVALNLPDVERDGMRELRSKDGAVGRPLPGQHVFTVDPATLAPLAPGAEGLLIVRSPSRMAGYLGRPDLTEAAFVQGGYATGDIGRVDADGFVFITGRLARFAKVGGEMVPLDHVEAAVQVVIGESCEIAVAAVSDPSRGERLVVLHVGWEGSWEDLFGRLEHLPPLWRPKPRDVYRVEGIPKLGTGKRDLGGIKRIAAEVAGKG